MKKYVSLAVMLVLVPVVVGGGALIFRERQSAWISLAVAALSCVPVAILYEKKETDARELVLIAAMTALSVVGRVLFAPLPGFKPVTAFVVITAMYFGGEAGFMTGALTALISNFTFGQGPWTPFQMAAWGLAGLLAGALSGPLRKSRALLAAYGALSGVLFSLLMDVWTVLFADGYLNLSRYAAAVLSSLPFTAIYAASNIAFLLLLARPIGKILDRVKTKYGIGAAGKK